MHQSVLTAGGDDGGDVRADAGADAHGDGDGAGASGGSTTAVEEGSLAASAIAVAGWRQAALQAASRTRTSRRPMPARVTIAPMRVMELGELTVRIAGGTDREG